MKRSSTRSTILYAGLLALLVAAFSSCSRLTRKTATSFASQTETVSSPGATTIKLNSATSAELEQLPGVGKVLAERIVAHRNKYGPFRRVEHLMVVRGISERKFRDLRPLLSID